MTTLSKESVLVWDYGLFFPVAEKLAEGFGKVIYYNATRKGWPRHNDGVVGTGVGEVEVTHTPFTHINNVSLVVFPDVHDGDLVEYLRGKGHRVYGIGKAEELEGERWEFRKLQKKLGMPTPNTTHIVGLSELRKHIAEANKKLFVKLCRWRGDQETFKVDGAGTVKQRLDRLEADLGAGAELVEFVVEEPIEDAVEVGFDGWVVDGKLPQICAYGYEIKDCGYVGAITPFESLPRPIRWTTERIANLLGSARGNFSTELRVTKAKPYLIDPTFRHPSPPTEVMLEAYENVPQMYWDIAEGKMPTPNPTGKYLAQVVLKSAEFKKDWLPIEYPQSIAQFVKIHNKAEVGGKVYAVPSPGVEMEEFGGVVAVGDTVEEAIELVRARAEQVKAPDLDTNLSALDTAKDTIEEGKQFGIAF